MNFRRIKHTLLRLSIEERTAMFGALMVIIGSLSPWYTMTFNFDEKNVVENGFTGDLGVIGFTVFIMTFAALLFLLSKHFRIPLPHFRQKKDHVILFLMGEGAFLLLLTMAIYTKRSLDFTNAEIRFGLYLSLIGACLSAFAAFAQIQRDEKEEEEEFFGYSDGTQVAIRHETPLPNPKPITKKEEFEPALAKKDEAHHSPHSAHQGSYFMKEAGLKMPEKTNETPSIHEEKNPSKQHHFYDNEKEE